MPDGAWDASFAQITCDLPLLRQAGPFWFNHPTPPLPFSLNRSLQLVPTVTFAPQPDDVMVLAGAFDSVNGEPRHRLARVGPDGSLRGRLILGLASGPPLRLSTPPEVEVPYVLQTSTALNFWTDFRTNSYPWAPLEETFIPDSPYRLFRARSQTQP